MRIRTRKMEKRAELHLWLTVHRVALRHGIHVPEGLSLAEAGTYVEDMIESAIGSYAEMRG